MSVGYYCWWGPISQCYLHFSVVHASLLPHISMVLTNYDDYPWHNVTTSGSHHVAMPKCLSAKMPLCLTGWLLLVFWIHT